MQFLKRYSFLIPIALLIVALFFIWHELAHLKFSDIRSALHQSPASSIGLAIALTI